MLRTYLFTARANSPCQGAWWSRKGQPQDTQKCRWNRKDYPLTQPVKYKKPHTPKSETPSAAPSNPLSAK